MDRWFHGRLTPLLAEPFVRGCGFACLVMTLTMPPLEIVPFATTLATAPIALFGLALLFRDGLIMILAFGISLGGAASALWFFLS